MARYHPPKEWLLDFVAGQLAEGFRLVLGAHIESCPQCQHGMQQLQALGAGLLRELPPTEMNADAFAKVWQQIQQAEATPAPSFNLSVREGLQKQLRDIKWQRLGPFRRANVLTTKDCHVSLLHIKAGARMPQHTHRGNEMTLILAGAYSDCYGRYDAGDLMVADGEHQHAPIASSDEDCICLVAESAPPRFIGPLLRLFNPLLKWN